VGTDGGAVISYTFRERGEDASIVLSATMLVETSIRVCDLAPAAVTSLSVSANGNYVVAATANGQLLQCLAGGGLGDTTPIRFLSTAFHEPCPIYGADVCARKPLLVTCSKDGTVRMWNLLTLELEMCKQFQEELTAIAIHPTGHQIAVGFADRLRIFHILNDDLKGYREFPMKVWTEIDC
jgi:WD40 repeat protein